MSSWFFINPRENNLRIERIGHDLVDLEDIFGTY